MIKLENASIDEFKDIIYPHYVSLFPEEERKSYKRIKDTYNKGILKIIKIMNDDTLVGFVITNALKDSKYLQLDYFGILKEYQNMGYGTQAIKLLKENSNEYNGIFIEVDKLGLGKDDTENMVRKRRVEFYERLGTYSLNYDLELFKVIFTPYVIGISKQKEDEDKIIKDIYEIYVAMLGKEIVEKNCKFIKL